MEVHFSPKAPDIYQVSKAPSNKYDTISNVIGLGVSGLMVAGLLGFAFYVVHSMNKDNGGK